MRLYDTDVAMRDHARRLTPDEAPHLHRFAAMDMDERWVTRSPREMLDTFHWFRGEGFRLIVDDLLALPGDRPVVAEGIRLLPGLVRPLLADGRRAVWLLPASEFRAAVLNGRGGTEWAFIGETGDPRRALRNLLERDAMFTERLAEETRRSGLNALEVDAAVAEEELALRVSTMFGLEEREVGLGE